MVYFSITLMFELIHVIIIFFVIICYLQIMCIKMSSLYLQGYWESLLQQLKAYIARARLRERHQSKLRQKLDELKNQVSSIIYSIHAFRGEVSGHLYQGEDCLHSILGL